MSEPPSQPPSQPAASPPPPPPGWGTPPQPPPGWGTPPGWGAPPQPVWFPPEHPRATTVMVLGIVGLAGGMVLGFPFLISPFAWWMGSRVVKEIDASGGMLGGRSSAKAGYILGIVGTGLLILGTILLIIYLAFIAVLIGASFSCGPNC